MERGLPPMLVMWDYILFVEWCDPEEGQEGVDPLSQLSPEVAGGLREWADAMNQAYADETRVMNPDPVIADKLDRQFDTLVQRIREEGFDVTQGEKWWRER